MATDTVTLEFHPVTACECLPDRKVALTFCPAQAPAVKTVPKSDFKNEGNGILSGPLKADILPGPWRSIICCNCKKDNLPNHIAVMQLLPSGQKIIVGLAKVLPPHAQN